MTAPRLEIDLDIIGDNARNLTRRLAAQGIAVCGVTKSTSGSPEIAHELLCAGVTSLGESRVNNVEHLRRFGFTGEILLVRSPMISEVERVVASADASLNSEPDVIDRLGAAARRHHDVHGIILMVELGDLREGVMPTDLAPLVERVLGSPGLRLRGIGANLACQNGIIPDASNMAELSTLAISIEEQFAIELELVSGGNSANLPWAFGPDTDTGRINHLRLGESILLGREPSGRTVLEGLRSDAVTLFGEVIESKVKPNQPRGHTGYAAFGDSAPRAAGWGTVRRVLVALGRQDTDPEGLTPPDGFDILGASSDHLVLSSAGPCRVGAELRFGLDYSALMRSMTSPNVARAYAQRPTPRGDRALTRRSETCSTNCGSMNTSGAPFALSDPEVT